LPWNPNERERYYVNGDKYSGDLSPDEPLQGEGTFTWANGSSWTGWFNKDKKNGPGPFYDASNGSKGTRTYIEDEVESTEVETVKDEPMNVEAPKAETVEVKTSACCACCVTF